MPARNVLMRLPAPLRTVLRRGLVLALRLLAALGLQRVVRGRVSVSGRDLAPVAAALRDTAAYRLSALDEPLLRPALRFRHGPEIRPREVQTATLVVDTQDPRYSFRNNVSLDHRRRVIAEERIPWDELPASFSFLEPVALRRGTVAYLSNTNVGNFYHWIALTLPLLRVYWDDCGISPDAYYVGRPVTGWHLETLAMLGIPEDAVITEGVSADRLVTGLQNRRNGAIDSPSLGFVRDQLGVPRFSSSSRRRLVIGRGDVAFRRFINEEECVDLLVHQHGFEYVTMDGKTVADEIELFSSAEAIVGVHGAALTNLLWAPSGCKVLELFPYGWNHPGYQELAAFVGCDYGYIVGSPDVPRAAGLDKPDSVRRENDLAVDVDVLAAALEALDI